MRRGGLALVFLAGRFEISGGVGAAHKFTLKFNENRCDLLAKF